jgi:hypothetical protein
MTVSYDTFMGNDTFPAQDGFALTSDLLEFFLWSCPSSMIPTAEIVTKWKETLLGRGAEFATLVAECDEWLMPNEGAER